MARNDDEFTPDTDDLADEQTFNGVPYIALDGMQDATIPELFAALGIHVRKTGPNTYEQINSHQLCGKPLDECRCYEDIARKTYEHDQIIRSFSE